MVDAEFLDWYYATIMDIKKKHKSRLQLIVCGDFFQLPPVAAMHSKRSLYQEAPDKDSLGLNKTPALSFFEQCEADVAKCSFVPIEFKEWNGWLGSNNEHPLCSSPGLTRLLPSNKTLTKYSITVYLS